MGLSGMIGLKMEINLKSMQLFKIYLKGHHYFKTIALSLSLFLFWSCSNDYNDIRSEADKGESLIAYAQIGENNEDKVNTRASYNAYDHWSVSAFEVGDEVGLFAVSGQQNPIDDTLFDTEIENGKMYCDGRTGNYYRFSNGDIVVDPQTVHANYSIMYYPYFADMPAAYNNASLPGLPIRRMDTDGIEKCTDVMQTFIYSKQTSNNTNSGWDPYNYVNYLPIASGVLQPKFYHLMTQIVVQRGSRFTSPKDDRVWIVMKEPCTDVRITQTSPSSSFSYKLQALYDNGDEFVELPDNDGQVIKINKHRVWQAWKGSDLNSQNSHYAIIPSQEVSYILIQDSEGVWQRVTDFYLHFENKLTSKEAIMGHRYIISVSMSGSNVLAKMLSIKDWNDGGQITDRRQRGINDKSDYMEWVSTYNSYVTERDPSYEEKLREFGDVVENQMTGETSWTFYLYSNLHFKEGDSYMIKSLDDTLMGASINTNYVVSGLQSFWIDELGPKGRLESIDIEGLYIIDLAESEDSFTGGLIRKLEGGQLENCNLLNGILVSNKNAGMLAGSVYGGTVKNCTFSGQVIGMGTARAPYKALFGLDPSEAGEPDLTGTTYSELFFETYN